MEKEIITHFDKIDENKIILDRTIRIIADSNDSIQLEFINDANVPDCNPFEGIVSHATDVIVYNILEKGKKVIFEGGIKEDYFVDENNNRRY